MTLYELIKKYGEGRGEAMMWKAVSVISDAVDSYMPEDEKSALVRRVYGEMSDGHYNEEFAREDIAKMYYVAPDGEKAYAPYWSEETLRSLYKRYKDQIPGYNCYDWMVTMNMSKSDYIQIINAWFPDLSEEEKNDRIVQLSINWLKDSDSPFAERKIWGYLNP